MSSEKKSAGPTCLAALIRIVRRSGSDIGRWIVLLSFRQMPVAVLDHHNGRIDEHTNRQRNAAQRHDVRGDSQPVHRNERHQHRDGQGEDCDERRTEVKQERR